MNEILFALLYILEWTVLERVGLSFLKVFKQTLEGEAVREALATDFLLWLEVPPSSTVPYMSLSVPWRKSGIN